MLSGVSKRSSAPLLTPAQSEATVVGLRAGSSLPLTVTNLLASASDDQRDMNFKKPHDSWREHFQQHRSSHQTVLKDKCESVRRDIVALRSNEVTLATISHRLREYQLNIKSYEDIAKSLKELESEKLFAPTRGSEDVDR